MTTSHEHADLPFDLEAVLEEIESFKIASTAFSQSATEAMAASVRLQKLILDDASLTLGEMACALGENARAQRASEIFEG